MSKRRRLSRAAKRIAARTVANAPARGAALEQQQEQQERPTRARHRAVVDTLHARNAITDEQLRAAVRLAIDFRASGSVIGSLVARSTLHGSGPSRNSLLFPTPPT